MSSEMQLGPLQKLAEQHMQVHACLLDLARQALTQATVREICTGSFVFNAICQWHTAGNRKHITHVSMPTQSRQNRCLTHVLKCVMLLCLTPPPQEVYEIELDVTTPDGLAKTKVMGPMLLP